MNRQIISALVGISLVGAIQANEQVNVVKENQEWLQGREVSKQITYDPANVDGFKEVKDFIVILDGTEAFENEIKLNRSFRDNLSDNVDKETIARMSQ